MKSTYHVVILATIRTLFVLMLLFLSYIILKPFLFMCAWGGIIAIGVHPLFEWLVRLLRGRRRLAALLLTAVALFILIIPSYLLMDSTIWTVNQLAQKFKAGTLSIPPPSDSIRNWPLVGKTVFEAWQLASSNLEAAIAKLAPYIKGYVPEFLMAIAGIGQIVFLTVVSILIAGVLLPHAEEARDVSHKIFRFLMEEGGERFSSISVSTIRSVVQGVLGIAAIQSISSGIAMLFFGIPGAGFWAILVLMLAVMQLPPLLVLLPVALYGFTYLSTVKAVIFLVLSVGISASDTLLKPIFLGRGTEIPMLVILLGSLGGMISFGIIGLFLGAVILAVAYKTLMAMVDVAGTME